MKPKRGKARHGTGHLYRPTYTLADGTVREQTTWVMAYTVKGKTIKATTGKTIKEEAEDVLQGRLKLARAGMAAGKRVTLTDLGNLMDADYRANGRKDDALTRIAAARAHLIAAFGATRAAKDIDEARITAYIDSRLSDGIAPATINRELAVLRRMFRLGVRNKVLDRRPEFSMLRENNARKGFFEHEQLLSVLGHLPEELRPLIEAAYITGWRINELTSRQWRHLDLKAGWLRLDPGETKSTKGRQFPVASRLAAILKAQRAATTKLEASGRVIPWIFHRDGEPIRNFRDEWVAARVAAGQPGRLVHDFRRTAVRNLIRAGVSQPAVMAMVGMETPSIFKRYAIVDEGMLKEAGQKLARFEASR